MSSGVQRVQSASVTSPDSLQNTIGKCRELADPFFPFPHLARANIRLRQMVEDETLPLESRHELGGGRKMLRINEDVVGEIAIFEQRDAAAECRAAA